MAFKLSAEDKAKVARKLGVMPAARETFDGPTKWMPELPCPICGTMNARSMAPCLCAEHDTTTNRRTFRRT